MNGTDRRRQLQTLVPLAVAAVAVAVVVFGVPLRSVLVLGVFLLCPLMMMGMHGSGHAHGDARQGSRDAHGSAGHGTNPERTLGGGEDAP